MLKGKSVIVTGSTSGIGLSIARAFAGEGANLTINGFGDKTTIEKERAGIEKEFGVKVQPGDVRLDNFETVNAIKRLVEARID